MYQKVNSSWGKHFDFILLDILCLQFSYTIAYAILEKGIVYCNQIYFQLAIVMCLLLGVISFFTDNYSDILKRGYLIEVKYTVKLTTGEFVFALVYLFLTKQSADVSRTVLITTWFANLMLTYIARCVRKKSLVENDPDAAQKNARNILIIAVEERMPYVIKHLVKNSYNYCKIIGCVVLDNNQLVGQHIEGVPVVAAWEDGVREFILENVVDEVFIDETKDSSNYGNELARASEVLVAAGLTVHYNLVHNPFHSVHETKVEDFYGYTVLTYSIKMATQRQLFIKRCLDILGGLVGCVLCGIAFLFVAPIIKIQSPGPVFFSQVRVGRNGRKFKMYKFRSMYTDAEERKKELMEQNKMSGLMFKMDNDPRIFPFGKFIRKTSIDEFPQFFNVLKGDMSLVGTRPPTVDEVEQYDLRHKSRLASKPGITGLWQVSGRSNITDFEEIVNLDNEYLENWKLSLDIKILFLTIIKVIKGEGSE